MIENIDLAQIQQQLLTWIQTDVWTIDTAVQLILIASAFLVAGVAYRITSEKLEKLIDEGNAAYRLKQILKNIGKLILPGIMLALVFLGTAIIGSDLVGLNIGLSAAVMKLLLAWIIIRLAVQFVENNFVRNIFALTIWAVAALSIVGVLDQTTATLDAVGMDIGNFRLSALAMVKGLFALFVLLYGALFVSGFLERRVNAVKGLSVSSRVLIGKIIRIALVTSALLVGVTTAGIDLSLLAVFGGAVGLGVGFGLQKGISNLFSGMLLLLDQSIKPGDVIELEGGTFGWVDHMGARYTEIITRDNKSFLIPNEDFITQRVVNWSHGSTLIRIEVKFGVDYSHNPHEIKKLAEEAATKPERIATEQPPVCHFTEFGDSSLNFQLRFWIKDAEKGVTNIRGEVMLSLWDTFREHGIKIPYPHREIYVHELPEIKTA